VDGTVAGCDPGRTLAAVRVGDRITRREARRLAVVAQGLGSPRPERAGAGPSVRAQLRRVMDRVGTIQLDAVNVVVRTQFLVAFSRIGAYDPGVMRGLSAPGGEWFEYWGHAASLLPMRLHPLLRWRMERWRQDLADSAAAQERRRAWRAANGEYLAAVLAEVDARGPLTAAQLSEPRRREGTWWDRRSDGRRALEVLFADGVLAAWRSASFERVYDLSDRVIPAPVRALPTPSAEEAQRELILVAAGALGVATAADLADYFWLRPLTASARIAELVEDGRLCEVAVEGWRSPAYVRPDSGAASLRRRRATLLSPFDSLIWNRERTERLFGLRYRIEIYVPAHRRTHGYYVLPLLLGDEIVARFDLKADRRGGALLVLAAHAEPGHDVDEVAREVAGELHRLRAWLGLGHLSIAPGGELAGRLAATAG
jgi:uncharacterized protein YcaQ